MAQWKGISLQLGRTLDRISLWPKQLFLKTLYLDQSEKIFRTNWSEIMKHFFGKNTYNEMKFLPG